MIRTYLLLANQYGELHTATLNYTLPCSLNNPSQLDSRQIISSCSKARVAHVWCAPTLKYVWGY